MNDHAGIVSKSLIVQAGIKEVAGCQPAAVAAVVFCSSSGEPSGFLYLSVPLGAAAKKDTAPVFGFMLRSSSDPTIVHANPLRQIPLVDVQFSANGARTVSFLGVDAGRFRAEGETGSAAQSSDVNWWLVGGIAVGAAVIINNSRKSDPAPQKLGGGFLCPPGTPC